MAGVVNRKFDSSLADKPHFRVEVTMGRMRITIWGQSCLMCFDMLPSCQLSFQDLSHLRVVEVLHGHALKWKGCRWQCIILGCKRGNGASCRCQCGNQTKGRSSCN